MNGAVLDAGAFVALERGHSRIAELFKKARAQEIPLVTSAGVVAQVFRGGARQTPITFALKWQGMEVIELGLRSARTIGRMLAVSGTADVIDAHTALLARERQWPIVTSDANDLRKIDPKALIFAI